MEKVPPKNLLWKTFRSSKDEIYRSKTGKVEFQKYMMDQIDLFTKRLRRTDKIGIEATGNTRFFLSHLKDKVSETKILNPYQFKVISQSTKKTDKNDAELIAFYLSKDMLPEVRMKEQHLVDLESLVSTRDKLKNKIHNLLLSQGILTKKEQFSSEKSLDRVRALEGLTDTAKFELKFICDEISHQNAQIKKLDEKIVLLAKKLKGFENLTSIKGIGERSAAILLSVIGNIDDFQSQKNLDAYFGIVPRVKNTSNTINHGRITKRGSQLARSALIQCTLVAIRYSTYLRDFFNKLKTTKGGGKAIIATSRKLLGIIYNTLKNDWVFEDFANFVLRETA